MPNSWESNNDQLIKVIDNTYLAALQNNVTDIIHNKILEILGYLQVKYNQVTIEEIIIKDIWLQSTTYNPSTPVNTVSHAVDKFCDLRSITGHTKIDIQITQLAYMILSRKPHINNKLISTNKSNYYQYQKGYYWRFEIYHNRCGHSDESRNRCNF